eukprot:4940298-Alexandrium_andersonii.AAC.1
MRPRDVVVRYALAHFALEALHAQSGRAVRVAHDLRNRVDWVPDERHALVGVREGGRAGPCAPG